MKLRNVTIFVDGKAAFLAAKFEVSWKNVWTPSLITFRDIITSDFTFEAFSQLIELKISGTAVKGCCLFYPVTGIVRNDNVKLAKIMGVSLAESGFNYNKAIGGIKATAAFAQKAMYGEPSIDQCQEILTEICARVRNDQERLLDDARSLKLLCRDKDMDKLAEDSPEIERYLAACEIDRVFNLEYVQGTKLTIKKSDLIMPYNEPLLEHVENDVLAKWSLPSNKGEYCKIGPAVNLPVPYWKNFVRYYEMLENNGPQDTTQDPFENELELYTTEFGDYASINLVGAKDIKLTFIPDDPEEVNVMLELVDFRTYREESPSINTEGKAVRGSILRIAPLHPEVYHIDELTPKFFDSFDYKTLIDDPSVNTTEAHVGYIRGFEHANKIPLLPRELYWYRSICREIRDALMYENGIFSVDEAERRVTKGERSKYANIMLRQLIEPVLQITRGFTGRAPFNGVRYAETTDSSEDSEDYSLTWACFYTIKGGKHLPIPVPPGYMPTDFGRYRSLISSLNNFVDTYVQDTYGFAEILIRLLRDKELKATMLVLDKAFRQQQSGRSPIYFDLLEARGTEIMDGIDNLTPASSQEVVFGVRLNTQPTLETAASNLSTSILGDNFRFGQNYIVGVGLWSSMMNTSRVSKVDFLDIFTLVQYIKERRNLAAVPINVSGIRYDTETRRFVKEEQDDEEDIANVLATKTEDGIDAGCISLHDALETELFESKEIRGGGRQEKEFRAIVEPLDYVKIRSAAAKATGLSKLAQEPDYQVFVQLEQLCSDLKRLDTSAGIYDKYHGSERIPALLDSSLYMHAMLDIGYTVNFLRLISYCVNNGIEPSCDFVEYLNAVDQFLSQSGTDTSSTTAFASVINKVKKWWRVVHVQGNNGLFVMLLGEIPIGGKAGYVVIENLPENTELLKKVQALPTFDPNTKYRFITIMDKVIRPYMRDDPKRLFAPNESSLKVLLGFYRKFSR